MDYFDEVIGNNEEEGTTQDGAYDEGEFQTEMDDPDEELRELDFN